MVPQSRIGSEDLAISPLETSSCWASRSALFVRFTGRSGRGGGEENEVGGLCCECIR